MVSIHALPPLLPNPHVLDIILTLEHSNKEQESEDSSIIYTLA